MKTVEINGSNLAYDVAGEGRPVIFVHGFLANSTGPYYERFKRMLAASYRVYSLDMRAHGGSAVADETVTLDRCAWDIVEFARQYDLQRPALVGHSMGGFLSMAAALLDPDLFSALALLTPAASQGQPNPNEVVDDFMAARKDKNLMNMRFGSMFVSPPDEVILDICREAALCLPDAVAERWMREEWPNSDLKDKLPSIHPPALSVIGAQDIVVGPERQYEDAMRMPHSKAVSFRDAGHMLPVENPERCAKEVFRFFDDVL